MLFLLLPSTSPIWPASSLLGICANVGFGASVVAMNAYLPTLARTSEHVVKARQEIHAAVSSETEQPAALRTSDDLEDDASAPLLASQEHPVREHGQSAETQALRDTYNDALSKTTSRISSQGIALGYVAGILMLIIALIPVTLLHGTTFSLRLAIGLSGLWWALFSLPAAAWLPSGKGVKEAHVEEEAWGGEGEQTAKESWSTWGEIVKAWKRLGNMLRWKEIKRLRNTFKFLAAWFLLSDGKPIPWSSWKVLIMTFGFRVHDYNQHRHALRQDVLEHARHIAHHHRHHQSPCRHRRLARLAADPAPLRLVEPADPRDARLSRQPAACVWLPGLPQRVPQAERQVRRFDDACGDVCLVGVFCELRYPLTE